MKELHEKGVDVKILDLGDLDVGSLVGQLMMTIYLIFGKHEAESIRIRMAEGKRMKHILEPDWKEGRPGKEFPEFERYYRRVKAKKMKVKDALLALGMCKPIWYKRCREMEAKMAEKTGMRNLKKLSESNK
jgi:DNA invertase Pin-like site-specific DNA recombinase